MNEMPSNVIPIERGKGKMPNKQEETERIVTPALRLRGEAHTGKTHGDAMVALEEAYPDLEDEEIPEEGFVTSTGRFVGRDVAAKIAHGSHQIDHPTGRLDSHDIEGYPEDIAL